MECLLDDFNGMFIIYELFPREVDLYKGYHSYIHNILYVICYMEANPVSKKINSM